jgi:hypothetical protein
VNLVDSVINVQLKLILRDDLWASVQSEAGPDAENDFLSRSSGIVIEAMMRTNGI